MISNILDTIAEIAEGLAGILVSLVNALVGIFWDTTDNALTLIGILALIALAASLTKFVFNWFMKLIKQKF